MNPIKLNLTKDYLHTINTIWQYFTFDATKKGKIDMSICQQIRERFLKKQIGIMDNPNKKEFTITLEYYEAATLDHYLGQVYRHIYPKDSLENSNLIEIYFELNQKV